MLQMRRLLGVLMWHCGISLIQLTLLKQTAEEMGHKQVPWETSPDFPQLRALVKISVHYYMFKCKCSFILKR